VHAVCLGRVFGPEKIPTGRHEADEGDEGERHDGITEFQINGIFWEGWVEDILPLFPSCFSSASCFPVGIP
jgi:hypothetical protein